MGVDGVDQSLERLELLSDLEQRSLHGSDDERTGAGVVVEEGATMDALLQRGATEARSQHHPEDEDGSCILPVDAHLLVEARGDRQIFGVEDRMRP